MMLDHIVQGRRNWYTPFGIAVILCTFIAGCTSLSFSHEQVSFESAELVLKQKKLQPDETERNGILLRFKAPGRKLPLTYVEKVVSYSQIDGDEGMKLAIEETRKQNLSPTPAGSLDVIELSTTKGNSGYGSKTYVMSSRGKVLKFKEGSFNTSGKQCLIEDWSRSPMFPEVAVRIGSKWRYCEALKYSVGSQLDSAPDELKVSCELAGFAEIHGARCAVIKTRAVQGVTQTITTWLKTLTVKSTSYADETVYFNYSAGRVEGKVSRSVTYSVSEDKTFSDITKAQSILRLQE